MQLKFAPTPCDKKLNFIPSILENGIYLTAPNKTFEYHGGKIEKRTKKGSQKKTKQLDYTVLSKTY